jgi:hypothetical protein
MLLSVKSQRRLRQLGVLDALARGEALVLAGPSYALRRDPAVHLRLAFLYDDRRTLCVGYASHASGGWEPAEHEPFSLRTLGYYERRLKRIGDVLQGPVRGVQR